MTPYLFGFIVPVASFALQIWPRFIKRYFGVDTWRWLLFADYVRRYKKLPKESPKQYIVSSVFGYPPVTIWLLSLFPKTFLEKYQFIISPIFDALNNYLIFIAGVVFTGNITGAIIAQVVAALTPIVAIEASNLNSRMLSSLIFTASFFPLILYTVNGKTIYLGIAAVGLFVLFFTHRFAVQAYIVCCVGLSIGERNPFYILFFLSLFALVNVMSPKLYGAIRKEHIASLAFWKDQIDLRFAHQFRGIAQTRKTIDFIQRVYSLSTKNPIAYVFGNSPWVLPFGFVLLVNGRFSKLELWAGSLIVWMFAVLFIKKLRIFGEGQRYLEYCSLPIGIVLGTYITSRGLGWLFIFGAVFMTIVIIYLQYNAIILDRPRSITNEVWEIIHYLNRQKNVRLAMFPLQLGDAILYFTKSKILTSDLYSGLRKLSDFFPVLKVSLERILKKYKINYIFFDRKYVQLEELKLTRYTIVFDKNDYVLLKI